MKLEVINENHNVQDFDCGDSSINEFLKNNALIDTNSYVSKTYVLKKKNNNKIIGFYTLFCSHLSNAEGAYVISRDYRPRKVPAILLGQLGIHSEYQGRGLGSSLLTKAIKDILKVSKVVSFAAIVIDAANDKVIRLYERNGFKKLLNKETKLFLSIPEAIITNQTLK